MSLMKDWFGNFALHEDPIATPATWMDSHLTKLKVVASSCTSPRRHLTSKTALKAICTPKQVPIGCTSNLDLKPKLTTSPAKQTDQLCGCVILPAPRMPTRDSCAVRKVQTLQLLSAPLPSQDDTRTTHDSNQPPQQTSRLPSPRKCGAWDVAF